MLNYYLKQKNFFQIFFCLGPPLRFFQKFVFGQKSYRAFRYRNFLFSQYLGHIKEHLSARKEFLGPCSIRKSKGLENFLVWERLRIFALRPRNRNLRNYFVALIEGYQNIPHL